MSSNKRLFREEAFARRRNTEALDGLLRVTAPHEWLILAGLGLALVGVACWALFGSVERTLSAGCVLVQPGERHTVISEFSGNVVDVLVDVGASLEAGQPLARLSDPELSRDVAVARARVDALEARSDTAQDALAPARAELLELTTIQALSEYIVSPYAGVVTRHAFVRGGAVAIGANVAEVREETGGWLEAVAFVTSERSERLGSGMEAKVLTGAADGGGRALDARVRDVAAHPSPPPRWLADLGLSAPARSHMVRASLRVSPPPGLGDGESCSLRVVLGEEPPIRLLAATAPG